MAKVSISWLFTRRYNLFLLFTPAVHWTTFLCLATLHCTPFGQIITLYFCLWLSTLQIENTLCIFDKHLEFYWVKKQATKQNETKNPEQQQTLLKRVCNDSLSYLQDVNYQSQEINVTWHLQCSETDLQIAWFTDEWNKTERS